jgi:hypothetical protein
MGESPSGDIQDLWTEYQATKALLVTLQSQLALVQGVASGIIDVVPGSAQDDYLSFSKGGNVGGENYSRESLLNRQGQLVTQIKNTFELMREQRRLAIMARSGYSARRVDRGGCGYGFRGWW